MSQHYGACILLITGLLSFSVAASEVEKVMSNDEVKVLSSIENMTSAFNNKDIDGVLTSYEKEAAVLFEPGSKVSDPEAIKQMFEGMFQVNPQFSYPHGHEVYISNDIAMHISPWVMQGTAPDGTKIEQSGLSVAVLRKQRDGQWLMVLDNPHGQRLIPAK